MLRWAVKALWCTRPAQHSERVVDFKHNSEDAPRTSAATRPKQARASSIANIILRTFHTQRCHPPKTARGSSIPTRVIRMLHAQSCHPPKSARASSIPNILRTLHVQHCHPPKTARASSIPTRVIRTLHAERCHPPKTPRWSSIPTRVIRTRQRCHPPKMTPRSSIRNIILRTLHAPALARWPSIPNGVRRTIHAPALPPTENSESVVDSKPNAPSASAATRRKQREGVRCDLLNSHGTTARAFRHPRSPQRVGRQKKSHSATSRPFQCESVSTRTIPAEGSPAKSKICTAPQRERFDMHNPRRGFASHVESSLCGVGDLCSYVVYVASSCVVVWCRRAVQVRAVVWCMCAL